MSETRTTARARVTITVEVDAPGVWGGDCPMSQLQKQGTTEALNRITHGLGQVGWRLVGKPLVQAIIVEETR